MFVTVNQSMDLQEQYEDLAAQQLDLRAELAPKKQELRDDLDKRHGELLQMVSALTHSFDGLQLNQQSKDNASTLAAKEKMLQSGLINKVTRCQRSAQKGVKLAQVPRQDKAQAKQAQCGRTPFCAVRTSDVQRG
uniref:Uncharacterized protein n=1 Tax=Nicotiana tabacum TaxID=4097 RepID=A0A1S4DFY1_TOBAC|nr:PREDICTED: uncharacterized protein LOC107829284 [Nicotiana tabacum]